MRCLRVLTGHPHLGQPTDIVRDLPVNAQAYVDAGIAEWWDVPGEDEVELTDVPPLAVTRTQVPETTAAIIAPGDIEATTPRPAGTRGARGGRRPRNVEGVSP